MKDGAKPIERLEREKKKSKRGISFVLWPISLEQLSS